MHRTDDWRYQKGKSDKVNTKNVYMNRNVMMCISNQNRSMQIDDGPCMYAYMYGHSSTGRITIDVNITLFKHVYAYVCATDSFDIARCSPQPLKQPTGEQLLTFLGCWTPTRSQGVGGPDWEALGAQGGSLKNEANASPRIAGSTQCVKPRSLRSRMWS